MTGRIEFGLTVEPSVLYMDRPHGVQLRNHLGLDVLVIAEGEVLLDTGAGTMSMESGSVLAGDTSDVEVIDAAAWGAAGVEVGSLPGQGRAGTEAMERNSRGKAEGGEKSREGRRELHDGKKGVAGLFAWVRCIQGSWYAGDRGESGRGFYIEYQQLKVVRRSRGRRVKPIHHFSGSLCFIVVSVNGEGGEEGKQPFLWRSKDEKGKRRPDWLWSSISATEPSICQHPVDHRNLGEDFAGLLHSEEEKTSYCF